MDITSPTSGNKISTSLGQAAAEQFNSAGYIVRAGFQYIKTDAMGKSCHAYSIPPEQLTLNDINVLVENEPSIIILPAFRMEVNNFNWNISNFVIESQDKVCEN